MTSSTLVNPTWLRPVGKSMPITDIAPSQCGHIVAATASVASHSRWAQVPQPRQTRSKIMPRREFRGTVFPPRSTLVQRAGKAELARKKQKIPGKARNLAGSVPQQAGESIAIETVQQCTERAAQLADIAPIAEGFDDYGRFLVPHGFPLNTHRQGLNLLRWHHHVHTEHLLSGFLHGAPTRLWETGVDSGCRRSVT